jgi:lipoyl-dependent peroxiredoxin
MARTIYTAHATVEGARDDGHGRSDDGALEVELRRPAEMGGDGGGTNPEQLFAVGYAACFAGALNVVARRERIDPGRVSIDSQVSLTPTSSGGFMLGVSLDVRLPKVGDPDQATALVARAHEVCPYSNATRGNIEVALSANGRALG